MPRRPRLPDFVVQDVAQEAIGESEIQPQRPLVRDQAPKQRFCRLKVLFGEVHICESHRGGG